MWRFELRKLWRRKQFLILSLIVIACVIIIFFRNYWLQDEIVNHAFQSLSPHSGNTYEIADEYRNEMIFRTGEDTLDEAFIAAHDNAQLMYDEFNRLLDTITDMEWDHVPEVETAFIKTVLNHIEYGGAYDAYVGSELEQSFDKNNILLKHSLPYEHELYSISNTNFMKVVFTFLLSVPGLAVLVFLLGDLLVMENEHNTIRTLTTQPITKWRLILGKFLGQLATVTITIAIIVFASYLIPLLFGGQMGSFAYPQLVQVEDGFEFISIGRYLLLYTFLYLGVASFVFSLALLFSSLFKVRLLVLFSTLITLFGGVYITNQFTVLQSSYNPYFYFNFQSIIEESGQLSSLLWMIFPYIIALLVLLLTVLLQKLKHTKKKGEKDLLPFDKGVISGRKNLLSHVSIFEWRKLRREGQVKQFIVIIVILIIGGYIITTLSTHQLREQYMYKTNGWISVYNERISIANQEIEKHQEVLNKLEEKNSTLTDDEKQLKEISESGLLYGSESLASALDGLERKMNELNSYNQSNWKPVFESWVVELTNWWKNPRYVDNKLTERPGGGLTDFTYMASVKEYEWMMEHNLKPVHNNRYTVETWTVYDKFLSPMGQLEWNQDTRKMDNTGLFYVYTLFTTPAYLILFGIFVFVLGVGMTGEKGVKRTLTFLKTQPVSISGIYLGKTWLSMLLTASIAVGTLLMMLLIGTIGNRFGDWKYPVIHYDPPSLVDTENYGGFIAEEGGFQFMNMGEYLLETGGLLLVSLMFLVALSLFFSLFFRHSISALFTTMIVAVGGYAASTLTKLSAVAQWSPFTYLNIGKIANGELAIVLENEGVTIITGCIALLLGIILLIIVGWVYAQSKWMKLE